MLLNKKHQAFVDVYFSSSFNATRAYMAAYGKDNERASAVSASRLLQNTNIRKEIDARLSLGNYIQKNDNEKPVGNVYLMREDAFGLCKIGIANNPMARLSSLQVSCPQNITLLGFLRIENARMYEAELHARYHDKHYRGEWFRLLDGDIDELLNEWKCLSEVTKKTDLDISPNPNMQLSYL